MRACEARYVLKMNREGRSNFYALVRKHRGDEAVAELMKNAGERHER